MVRPLGQPLLNEKLLLIMDWRVVGGSKKAWYVFRLNKATVELSQHFPSFILWNFLTKRGCLYRRFCRPKAFFINPRLRWFLLTLFWSFKTKRKLFILLSLLSSSRMVPKPSFRWLKYLGWLIKTTKILWNENTTHSCNVFLLDSKFFIFPWKEVRKLQIQW